MLFRNLRIKFLKIEEDIDLVDHYGKTLLMHATANENQKDIDMLLKLNADPFRGDKYGYSAFTIAIRNGNEDLVLRFIEIKIPTLLDELSSDSEGVFHYIAAQLCKRNSEFRNLLGFDDSGTRQCFVAAKRICEDLGMDSTDLLFLDKSGLVW